MIEFILGFFTLSFLMIVVYFFSPDTTEKCKEDRKLDWCSQCSDVFSCNKADLSGPWKGSR